jgi:lysophospholipase L1-like esterase
MRRILLSVLWLLFVAVLLQLAGWIYFSVGGAKPIEGYGYPVGLYVPDQRLGYAYQPGFTGLFKGAGYRDIPIEINADGFRDAPFEPVSAGRARIAFLGDSVVFGAGVRAGDRFTECLEAGDGSTEGGSGAPLILNLGVNSYSFGHYLALAERKLPALRPSAVVVGLTLNDFAPMDDSGPARRIRRQAEGLHTPGWLQRIKERIAGTYAGRFLSELRTRVRYALMNADQREEYHTKWMRTVVAAWAEPETRAKFGADLDQLAALVAADRLPLGFVLFPELNDLLHPDDFSGPRRTLLRLLRERDLKVCDPYDDFARQPDPRQLFLAHDGVHYNPAGHGLMCAALQRCLDDWGFLAP